MAYLALPFYLLLGLTIGSFINVCIHRMPRDESVCTPRSHCPRCGSLIRWYDNIPLLSYVLLGRKCRHCGAPISLQYPFIEGVTGLAFVAVAWFHPFDPITILYLYFAFALITTAAIDWYHQVIPDFFSYSLLCAGLAFSPLNASLGPDWHARLISAVMGAVTGFGVLYLIALLGEAVVGKEVMGGGDIKLLCGLGAGLGWEKVLSTLFMASLMGSIAGIVLIVIGRMRRRDYLPFGPFIACAAFINIFLPNPRLWLMQLDITRLSYVKILLDKLTKI